MRALTLILVLLSGLVVAPQGRITVYMIGDSTMADKPTDDNPERGWGQMFPAFFDSSVVIDNRAMNGRSTRSFLAERRWEPILEALRPGDYVFIQFGHNDEKPEKTDRYTPPDDYRKNLVRFVSETLARSAQPVLCTPIVRRRFDNEGKFYDEHGVYPGIVREVAAQYNVPLLDMHRTSWELVERLGEEGSKNIFLWIKPGSYRSLPQGREDNTHFSEEGATKMAALAAAGIRELQIGLAAHLKPAADEAAFTVTNPAPFDRPLETVELAWTELQRRLGLSPTDDLEVVEGEGRLVTQKIDADRDGTPELVVFQTHFGAKEEKRFTARKGREVPPAAFLTDAKYILPRKDVAWENDRIGFRIYGGPLAGDVRNGIDVWVKRVRYRIMDKWYHGDSLRGDKRVSYHVDHGEGADYFLVAKSLGAGGCALWSEGNLRQTVFFTSYEILATGPVRALFRVTYQSEAGAAFTESKTYSLDAGKNVSRIEVRYTGNSSGEVALGLVKRNGTVRSANQAEGWMSLWGPVDDSSHGSLGTGVVAPAASIRELRDDSVHHLMVVKLSPENTVTYYAGAGWTGSGDFATAADWEACLSLIARGLQYPLAVSF